MELDVTDDCGHYRGIKIFVKSVVGTNIVFDVSGINYCIGSGGPRETTAKHACRGDPERLLHLLTQGAV